MSLPGCRYSLLVLHDCCRFLINTLQQLILTRQKTVDARAAERSKNTHLDKTAWLLGLLFLSSEGPTLASCTRANCDSRQLNIRRERCSSDIWIRFR